VLFGEGIINDAVAIVLYKTVADLELSEENGLEYLFCYSAYRLSSG